MTASFQTETKACITDRWAQVRTEGHQLVNRAARWWVTGVTSHNSSTPASGAAGTVPAAPLASVELLLLLYNVAGLLSRSCRRC